MADVIKDVLMGKLFGTSGTSSGGGSSGGGGSSSAVSPKEVNFYDYDGTCVYAYSVAEAQKLSELPAGPEHSGLVFQGWNWSLEGVKGLTRAMNIGAMYTTDDGTTRLYITLQEGRTSPMLGVGVNGTVTVDWGDGTEPDVLTGTSTSTTVWTENHAYAAPGDYVIRLTVDGEMAFRGSEYFNVGANVLSHSSQPSYANSSYQNALRRVEIGNNAIIGSAGFCYCRSLESISIPQSQLYIEMRSFFACRGLKYVTVPIAATSVGQYAFADCTSLKSVSMPQGVTFSSRDTFGNCYSLVSFTLPDGVGTLVARILEYCESLAFVDIPESVTSIESYAFYRCYCLVSVKIPKGVTSINVETFNNCYSMAYYDFTSHTAVPTLANTNAFKNIPADCEIRVPAALYDEWIAATNWATYASQIKAY